MFTTHNSFTPTHAHTHTPLQAQMSVPTGCHSTTPNTHEHTHTHTTHAGAKAKQAPNTHILTRLCIPKHTLTQTLIHALPQHALTHKNNRILLLLTRTYCFFPISCDINLISATLGQLAHHNDIGFMIIHLFSCVCVCVCDMCVCVRQNDMCVSGRMRCVSGRMTCVCQAE